MNLNGLNKKILMAFLVFVGLIVFLSLSGYLNINRIFATHEMSGKITEVQGSFIVVTGVMGSSDPQDTGPEERIIKFKVTSETVLNNLAIRITAEQLRGGGKFSPENKVIPGSFSELVPGLTVKILSKDDLFSFNKEIALQISYASYDIEFPKQ